MNVALVGMGYVGADRQTVIDVVGGPRAERVPAERYIGIAW